MARNIGADGRTIYRAVITLTEHDGTQSTRYEGPYDNAGTARARVTFWRRYMARWDGTATGHVEQAHPVWTPVGEQADPIAAAVAQTYRAAADAIKNAPPGPTDFECGCSRIDAAAALLRRRADETHPTQQ